MSFMIEKLTYGFRMLSKAFYYWRKLAFPNDLQNPYYYRDRLYEYLGCLNHQDLVAWGRWRFREHYPQYRQWKRDREPSFNNENLDEIPF